MEAVGFKGQKASFQDSLTKISKKSPFTSNNEDRDRVAAVLITLALKTGMPEFGTAFVKKVRSVASIARPLTELSPPNSG